MALPPRLHLMHHLLDAMPPTRWFSAWELAELLYRDRGGAHRQQKAQLIPWLDLYTRTPLLEARDDLTRCRVYRRVETEAMPAWTDDSRATLAAIKQHAARPMSHDALEALPRLTRAVKAFAETGFDPRCYLETGRRLTHPPPDREATPLRVDEPERRLPTMLTEHEADERWLQLCPWHGWRNGPAAG